MSPKRRTPKVEVWRRRDTTLSDNPYAEEFTGNKRLVVVWIKRTTLGSSDWDPVACRTSREAAEELKRARRAGHQAFTATYRKARRTAGDRRAERLSEDEE